MFAKREVRQVQPGSWKAEEGRLPQVYLLLGVILIRIYRIMITT